jgi:DNA-directed RNA polymerase sigma subunit (sigma70/sigma32)
MKDLLVDAKRENNDSMDMESLAYDIKRVLRKLDGRKERILKMWY